MKDKLLIDEQRATTLFDAYCSSETNQGHYYVDFVPITFMNEDFAELADYLAINYKPDFAKKIIFIAFTILCYYDSAVFLPGDDYLEKYTNKDLRHTDLESIAKEIRDKIIKNRMGLYIFFQTEDKDHISVMSIEDEYSTHFFGLSGEAQKMIEQLVTHQGLFFKKVKNID